MQRKEDDLQLCTKRRTGKSNLVVAARAPSVHILLLVRTSLQLCCSTCRLMMIICNKTSYYYAPISVCLRIGNAVHADAGSARGLPIDMHACQLLLRVHAQCTSQEQQPVLTLDAARVL